MNADAKTFLKECLKIYSPSEQEKDFADFLAKFLENSGFKVKFDNVGNLIAKKGSGKPVFLLITHLDTIPGELAVEEKEGKIYGRGVVDCKSSLAAMVYSISRYDFNNEKAGKIIFTGIVQEKNSIIGIEEFLKTQIKPDCAIIGAPTKINQICIGYKGRLCIGYRVLSQSGHVASSWEYVNAIDVCMEIWKMIKGVCWQLTDIFCPKGTELRYYNQIIPTLTVISGGMLTDCVPSQCEMHIDIRFPAIVKIENLVNEIRKSVINFKEVYQQQFNMKFQVKENITSLLQGVESKEDELVIQALRGAILNNIEVEPNIIKKTGTTFLNAINIHYGIPSITYGPGDPKLEHSKEDFIEIDEYLKSIEIYSNFFDKLFELYKK